MSGSMIEPKPHFRFILLYDSLDESAKEWGGEKKKKKHEFGVIVKSNLSVLLFFLKVKLLQKFLPQLSHCWEALLIKSSLLPTQFAWHLYCGAVIISTTRCRDESASPLAGSPPAALEGWRVKRVRSGRWLELREAERRLGEKGSIRDELVQSAHGRAEAEQGSVN